MKKKDSKLTCFKVLIVLMFAAVFLFACGSEKKTEQPAPKVQTPKVKKKKKKPETIKIGVAGAYSGDLASLGIPSKRGVELMVSQVNAEGGIFNKKIELIVEDDMCKPDAAAAAASRLVKQGVRMVLGHTCSGATKAALDVYKPANAFAISSSATNPDLTRSGSYPNFFRTISPDDAQAEIQVKYILETLKLKKVAVIHDQDDYGKGLANYAAEFLKSSGQAELVLHDGITAGAGDYRDIVDKIKKNGAEAVIYGGYHPEAAGIVTLMRKKNMKIPFISGDGVRDIAFINTAGEYAEEVYATGPQDTSTHDMAIAAIEAHKKTYGKEPGPYFLNACAGALVLFNAIEKSGSMNTDSIQKFLRLSFVKTPLGAISFDRQGNVRGYGFSMAQVRNGAFVEMAVESK